MRLAINGGCPVRQRFLPYGSPEIGQEEIDEVVACLKSGWLSTGARTEQLEEDIKKYTGARYAVATNSCTSAMHLSLLVQGIGQGDEVITTPMTFAATTNVIEHVGATPVLVDVGKDSFNIDPQAIEKHITSRTRAIMPVHYAGFPCEMDAINDVALKYGLTVIEDAAHAIGTKYHGKTIGGGENTACFSFYVTKNVAAGEGGMVTTRDQDMADRMRIYGLHGMSRGAYQRYTGTDRIHYDVIYPGHKYNMPDIAASIALHQLKKLERFIEVRRKYAEMYFDALKGEDTLILPDSLRNNKSGNRCAWHLYPIMIKPEQLKASRDGIMRALIHENIGVATHFRAIFDQKYYKDKYRYSPEDYPNAKFISDRVFSISLSTNMSTEDLYDVVRALKKVLGYYRR